MFKRQWIVAAVVAGVAGAVAWACGPMFPNQLLDHRAGTLKAVPQNSFAFEAMHLLPATDKLVAEEPSPYGSDRSGGDDAEAKSQGVTPAQLVRIKTLRALGSGDDAYEQGKDLPEDLRAYTAGAVDYATGNSGKALSRFEQVLAMPPEQATLRAVWAAYMLGSIHADEARQQAADATAFARERNASAKAFQLARTRAVDGASDTQGLAVASFGEEARLYLYSHGKQCTWGDLSGAVSDDGYPQDDASDENRTRIDPHCGEGIAADDFKRAITLYAAQAGHGSSSAVNSLVAVADFAMRHPPLMDSWVDSPIPQRLLVAYALARMDGQTDEATSDGKTSKADPRLSALVAAIEKRGLDHVAGADRLASLAYQVGHYGLSARLVEKSSGPLAEWVRAKLALQKGDMVAANAAYAAAAKAFPTVGDEHAAIEPANAHLIVGEQGVLSLARGEYVEALGHLYDAALSIGGDGNVYDWDMETASYGYGNDAVYIAERVLAVDELKSFVDARAPATPVPSQKANSEEAYRYRSPIGDNLRWILARRLMRAGRYDEAFAYFPADNDWRFGSYDTLAQPKDGSYRSFARAYAKALHDSEHAWTDIGKAQALYAAAVMAREHGMEILGYEQGPDYADSDGGYQGGSGQTEESLKQSYVTEGERKRFAESMATPNRRFHYRYVAADEASHAADLLPARSQAFAAVLCQATGWMLEGPPDYEDNYPHYGDPAPSQPPERVRRAMATYDRYVQQGPYVEWADDFGRKCEEPDFDRARVLKRSQQMAAVKHAVRRDAPYALGGLVLAAAALGAWLMRRRRASVRGPDDAR